MDATIDTGYSPLRCYLLDARNELVRVLRAPSFAIPTLVFPPMFYLLFAVLLGGRNPDPGARIDLLATYGVFGVMAPGLFGFGVTVATDRERGWLAWRRAMPTPPGGYLVAKLAMAAAFAATIWAILAVIATTVAGVQLPASTWATLLLVDVLGVLPFCALGLLVGTFTTAQAAPAVANLIYLPMAFLSGLWMPLTSLPHVLQAVAPIWPAWHLGRIALAAVGQAPGEALLPHVLALGAATLVLVALARYRLRRA